MAAQRAGLVAHATAHGGVGDGDGVEEGADRDRRRQVEVEAGRSSSVGPQRRGQADDDPQRSTAVFTQSTGGRKRATSCQVAPASGEANTSPVRVPT